MVCKNVKRAQTCLSVHVLIGHSKQTINNQINLSHHIQHLWHIRRKSKVCYELYIDANPSRMFFNVTSFHFQCSRTCTPAPSKKLLLAAGNIQDANTIWAISYNNTRNSKLHAFLSKLYFKVKNGQLSQTKYIYFSWKVHLEDTHSP